MYHGLDPEVAMDIIRGGFIPRECQHGAKAVYLTPSIRYAAHPRYARVCQVGSLFYQVVLQVRVVNAHLTQWNKECEQKSEERRRYLAKLAKNYDLPVIGTSDETMLADEIIDVNRPANENLENSSSSRRRAGSCRRTVCL